MLPEAVWLAEGWVQLDVERAGSESDCARQGHMGEPSTAIR